MNRAKTFFVAACGLLALLAASGWQPEPAWSPPDLSAYPWLYLRAGQPLAAGEQAAQLLITGDVMLGRGVAGQAAPLADVTPWLRTADLTLGNLEGVLTDRSLPCPSAPAIANTGRAAAYCLPMPSSAATTLSQAGFDILSLANNHAMDGGPAGLAESITHLEEAGIAPLGVVPGTGAPATPLIRAVGEVRLAFLAFNAVPYPPQPAQNPTVANWNLAAAQAAIAAARAQADAVIVSIHWGYEYELRPDPAQRAAAAAMLAAGADLVVGTHPHVVQLDGKDGSLAATRTQDGRDAAVVYSLGNFVFDQQMPEARQGLAVRAWFDRQGLRAVQALPVWAGTRPRLMSLTQAAPLVSRLQPFVQHLWFACTRTTCDRVNAGAQPVAGTHAGLFAAGGIDLAGDGLAEQVRRQGEQVIVYAPTGEPASDSAATTAGQTELWRSPAEWRVADVALGDPNDDGRGELFLALWKPDKDGTLRSHPFIIGYREGIYRTLWGGSAVADPLREVELADPDGDGTQELIVLEEGQGETAHTLAVWRWNGWGFSLAWRSLPGAYHDLTVVPARAGQHALISVAE
jgi:poly-gamma-glutamate synthesis protein (capsule biosynthesis protein)